MDIPSQASYRGQWAVFGVLVDLFRHYRYTYYPQLLSSPVASFLVPGLSLLSAPTSSVQLPINTMWSYAGLEAL